MAERGRWARCLCPAPPSQLTPLQVGDRCVVHSASAGDWVEAEVIAVDEQGDASITYGGGLDESGLQLPDRGKKVPAVPCDEWHPLFDDPDDPIPEEEPPPPPEFVHTHSVVFACDSWTCSERAPCVSRPEPEPEPEEELESVDFTLIPADEQPASEKTWDQMTPEEQMAAALLGNHRSHAKPASGLAILRSCIWQVACDYVPTSTPALACVLRSVTDRWLVVAGWDAQIWDSGDENAAMAPFHREWSLMNAEEKRCVRILGYPPEDFRMEGERGVQPGADKGYLHKQSHSCSCTCWPFLTECF